MTLFNKDLAFLFDAPVLLRVLAFFLVWVGMWIPIAVPLALILRWNPAKPLIPSQKLPLLASLYLLAPFVLWGAVLLEEKSFADLGLPWSFSVLVSLGLGLLLGVLGLGIMFGVEQGLGWMQWQLNATPATESTRPENAGPALVPTLLLTLLLGIWVSLTEELVFRGFLQNQLQQAYAPWVAAAIASLIFALLHLVWEGRENIPQLPGLWLMGMVLTLARWVDGGNLGLAWGLHAGWIWAIASLDATQALSYTGRGAAWLTGLGGRPLAGLLGILFLLATAALLWLGQTTRT